MTQPSSHTAAQIATTRHLLGLTNSGLAQLCGVNDRRVRSWLTGESQPSPTAATRLDQALNNLTTSAETRLKTAMRSRPRPIVLELAADGSDQAVVALVAGMLAVRGVPYRVQSAEGDS